MACSTSPNFGLESVSSRFVRVRSYKPDPIIRLAKDSAVDFIFPADENALFLGIADAASKAGLPCLGHSRNTACILEQSRASVIGLLKPRHPAFFTDGQVVTAAPQLAGFMKTHPRVVLKPANQTTSAAFQQVQLLQTTGLGRKGGVAYPIWAETYSPGKDFSLHFIAVGDTTYFLGETIDYPLLAKDTFKPTGGMGAIAPGSMEHSFVTNATISRCIKFVKDFLEDPPAGLRPSGFISAQFRKTQRGVLFTEFDCKPGTPEVVALLPTLSINLGEFLNACLSQNNVVVRKDDQATVAWVLAPKRYPDRHQANSSVRFPASLMSNDIFTGPTFQRGKNICGQTSRTACVVATAPQVAAARQAALERVLQFATPDTGLVFREDVGAGISLSSATERVRDSLARLNNRGGKRVMLRLSPEAYEAVINFMSTSGIRTETAAINAMLLSACLNHRL